MRKVKIYTGILLLVGLSILFQACHFDFFDKIRYGYEIKDGKYLIVEGHGKKMLVTEETTDYIFAHHAELKVITKDLTTGEIGLADNFNLKNVMTAVVGGIEFKSGEIELNDKIYLMTEYKTGMEIEDALNLNDLFVEQEKDLQFNLNVEEPDTLIYDGNTYEIGEDYEDELGRQLSFVYYEDKPIFTITFDRETNKILFSKEKLFMLKSSKEEADKIIILDFEAVYKGKDGYVIGVNNKYKKLIQR